MFASPYTGIAAAALGAKKIFFTDFPGKLDRNIVANKLTDVPSTTPLTWGNKLDLEVSNFNLVLPTDVMYYDGAVELLLLTLQSITGRAQEHKNIHGLWRNRQAEATLMMAVEESTELCSKIADIHT